MHWDGYVLININKHTDICLNDTFSWYLYVLIIPFHGIYANKNVKPRPHLNFFYWTQNILTVGSPPKNWRCRILRWNINRVFDIFHAEMEGGEGQSHPLQCFWSQYFLVSVNFGTIIFWSQYMLVSVNFASPSIFWSQKCINWDQNIPTESFKLNQYIRNMPK